MRLLAVGLLLCGWVNSSALADTDKQLADRLDRQESGDFVLAAMRAELEPSYRKRGLGLDYEGTEIPHFYSWAVVPSWGQGVDYFVVDRRTGDVWADLGCRLIRSKELTALQKRFRRRFRVPTAEVQRIETAGSPAIGCEPE